MTTNFSTGFGWTEDSTQTLPLIGTWTPAPSGGWTKIPIGTAGQVLAVNGTANGYQYVTINSVATNFINTSSATLSPNTRNVILFGSACTLTLPATISAGQAIEIVGGASTFTVVPAAGQSIAYSTSIGASGPTGVLSALAPRMTVTILCIVSDVNMQVTGVQSGSVSLVT